MIALLFASTAQAQTAVIGSSVYQAWVGQSAMPTPDISLTVVEGTCPDGPLACTVPAEAMVWMPSQEQRVFYHELGHNFDYYEMTPWSRGRYMEIMGLAGEWEQRSTDYAEEHMHSPNELFAESYALCSFKPWIDKYGSIRGQWPVGGWKKHDQACKLIQKVASWGTSGT